VAEIGAEIKASVVVIVYNAQKTLKSCLDSLMALDFPKNQYEILVVDNHSTDGTKNIILQYPVTYLFEPNRGRGWARNKGVKAARGEFVAFTDADCIATSDWLKNLLEGFKDSEEVAICGGKIIAFRQQTAFEKYVEQKGILDQEKGIKGDNPQDLPRAVTANAAFRRSIFEKAGYFDEELITSEDTEISWRISLLGYEIKYVPQATIYHQHTKTLADFCRHHFDFGRAAVVINQKYGKMYFGVGGPSSLFQAVVVSLRVFFILMGRLLEALGKGIGQEKILFIIFDATLRTSYNMGCFCALLQAYDPRQKRVATSKIPLDHFFRQFAFHNDATKWSSSQPLTWFLNDGIMRLVVFFEGLHVYKLNRTATRIFLNLLKTSDLTETIETMAASYQVARNTVDQDVREFLAMLKDERILQQA